MKKLNLLFILLLISSGQALRMKRVVYLLAGPYIAPGGYPIAADTDHDSLNEIIFFTQLPTRWEIWEYCPINQYQLVYADTGIYPYPPGITTGNFWPEDVGDIDQDSLTDLLGPNVDKPQNPDTFYNVVTIQESPNYTYYPESLTWSYRHTNNAAISQPFYFPPDLDSDNRNEIMFVTYPPLGVVIFENVSNNQNVVVWNTIQGLTAWSFTFGDFDLDGYKEFVTAGLETSGKVYIYENTGDNQYEQVWIDTVQIPNGKDVFSGNDLDGDSLPEFFVGFAQYVGGTSWDFYLYMWEATGNNTYQRTLVVQRRLTTSSSTGRRSRCGDIDGDGIEELVWATPNMVYAFKATGNNQFSQVWQEVGNGTYEALLVNIYDVNQNGYNEIIVTGSNRTALYEVEAVWVRRPWGGLTFYGNTQEQILWQTFYPPRCDSVSLFYSIDNGRTYDTIITGISGIDTSYLWRVPNVSSDSCKIKIIAYGPGWQYDENDRVFRIVATGIEEDTLSLIQHFRLELYPNPSKGSIRYKIWDNSSKNLTLKIYNLAGELVRTFYPKTNNYKPTTVLWNGRDEDNKVLPNGIYFLEYKSDTLTVIKRVLLLK